MSQTNRKHKRLEALFSEAKPVEPDPIAQSSNSEVDFLKARVVTLESELEAKLGQQGTAPLKTTTFEGINGADNVFRPHELDEEMQTESAEEFAPNIERIGKIGLPASIIAASLYLFLALQFGNWQLYAWSVDIWILALAVFTSIILSRRGHVTWGAGLLLTAISFTFIGAVALIEGIGLLLGISIVLLISIIAGQTLPAKAASRAIVFGVLSGITAVLLEVYLPAYRLPQPDIIHVFLPGILGVVILLYGYVTVRQFRNYKLRTKLIIAFITIVVGSVGIVAFLTNRSLQTSLTQDIGNKLSVLANAKASEIGQLVERESDVLKALALNKTIQDAAELASRKTLSQAEIEQLDSQWRTAEANNNNHDTLVADVLNNDLASELLQFQGGFPQHVEVFLTNQQGINIAATNRTSDYYQADEEWWQIAYQNGLFIGQPEYDESSKTIAMIMAVAVRAHGSGNIVGILRTTVDFGTLTDLLASGLFGKTGHTDIYLPNGQEITLKAGQGGSELVLENAEIDVDELKKATQSYLQVLHNDIPTLVGQASIIIPGDLKEDAKAVTDLNWRVVALQDRAEAMQPVEAQTRSVLFSAIAIAIVTTLAAIGMAQILSGPITRLNAVAGRVASGDLSAQAKVETGDETGTLATTFNMMTTRLRNMIGSLEQRVAERTHDLALASEVGRAVSEKIGDLTEMLSHAVELIRSRYGLYYTQIYLLDISGRSLVLRSGTGEVGRQLLQRGHRLPISASSLNSRAASTQKPVLVGDTQKSDNFLPNPLLPLTRSELAVPLIVNEKVVGVLDMQSNKPNTFTEVNIPAFQVLAGQLAIAIQNSNLLNQTEEARMQVEEQTRRLTSAGWKEFLNAVDRSETIGYSFNQNEVLALADTQKTILENALVIPIEVAGANIGEVQLADEATRTWAVEETEIVQATMAQVAQHIENLRLLAQAEHYRAEAEQAVRRLTRDGWDAYLQQQSEEATSFAYNLNEVYPLTEVANEHHHSGMVHLLAVRDEVIGELSVDIGDDSQEETKEIISTVAAQLSAHIDSLRLSISNMSLLKSTEERARREQILRQITGSLRSSNNPATIMRTAVRELGSILGRRAIVQLVSPTQADQAESAASNENKLDAPGATF